MKMTNLECLEDVPTSSKKRPTKSRSHGVVIRVGVHF